MALKDIQQRLNDSADAKLRSHVESLFKHIDDASLVRGVSGFHRRNNDNSMSAATIREIIDGLKKKYIEYLTDSWRNVEVNEFMNRVQSLSDQMDELRQQIAD